MVMVTARHSKGLIPMYREFGGVSSPATDNPSPAFLHDLPAGADKVEEASDGAAGQDSPTAPW